MHINLTGHHLDLTDPLRDYVNEKLSKLERHFDHVTKLHVILGIEKHQHKAEATMHVAGGNGDLFAENTASVHCRCTILSVSVEPENQSVIFP